MNKRKFYEIFNKSFLSVTCKKVDVMDMVTIQLKHANAKKLLQELESMDIIKVIGQSSENDESLKPSQLRGFLTKEKADELLLNVETTRKEWEERLPAK